MTGFGELVQLLQSDPTHRLVIIREDGTPIGVFLGLHEYQTLRLGKEILENPGNANEQKQHEEWDAMMEKVSGVENDADQEDTYLFEPVE